MGTTLTVRSSPESPERSAPGSSKFSAVASFVDVHDAGLVFVTPCLQLFQRVFGQLVGFAAARSVVVGRH
ncbi:hypothetical protein AORI_2587 [Amycolatopsis keratiniphila]|uniref:Uncharacterized protein n=1 Tax=Amycolatopsis keratiniphila TaxID=129921 RepID=R4SRD3_9PSEU|nr:hypothetical protein AORI_2587 [Amycolatopsis keratiniphila]